MSNRFILRYSVVGVAIICFCLLIAIRNQPSGRRFTKTGHHKNSFKHNKHNLQLARAKGARHPQAIYKDFKEQPEEMSEYDDSSYFYGSSYSVSISSSFYGNRSKVHTSFSSSSDSYVNADDAKFLEEIKNRHKLKRQKKVARRKAARAERLGKTKNMEAPAAAKIRLRNGAEIDEEGNVIRQIQKKEKKKPSKTKHSRKGRSVDDLEPVEWEYFNERVELRQIDRRNRMKTYCDARQRNKDISDYTKRHLLVIPDHQLLYCFVPKAGCSNWKRIMMVLTGQSESVDGLTSDEVHVKAKFQFFSALPIDKQQEILETYYKFTFVRDPMKRLLSVYRNKFGDKNYYRKNKSFHPYGKGIISHFRQNATKHQKMSGEGVTWPEFAKYLLSPQVRKKYESGSDVYRKDHWDIQTKICSPCDVNYDFIGNLETIDDDSIYLLRQWGVQEKVKYLPNETSRPTNSTDTTVFNRNYGLLTDEQRERLFNMFRDDFEAFGYDNPPFIS
ncbi:Carbohydrate sulfotransferase 11 [Holothuria leucospilota]|uniref:Carbohydrate sulfotransferase n=1 Tax=Holothuria leucospilota TaxID=206669 RepID=A0A9Q0YCW2_HOLLE|nr:Carbohydrate sulfotransferase 11 [Holothuria leucospilota]